MAATFKCVYFNNVFVMTILNIHKKQENKINSKHA